MKFVKFGVLTAFAGLAFVACAGDTKSEKGTAKAEFNLMTPEGVELTEVTYDLDTSTGTQVKTGVISVPNDDSVINGFIGALPLNSYQVSFTATGTYLGSPVSCSTAAPSPFVIDEDGETVAISPNPTLVCTVTQEIGQDTGNVTFTVDVEVETIQIVVDTLETFTVAPTTAAVTNSGGSCTWAPVGIDMDDTLAAGVTVSWEASPDGTFTLDSDNTDGTYNCATPGAKTLTVTATLGGASASIDVPVICNDDDCGIEPPPCGNGTVDAGEDCDDNLEGCVDCQVTCGDGLVYAAIEECDDGNINDGDSCSSTCQDEPCAMGTIECSGACVDPLSDEANCGDCGTACASGDSCEEGVCTAGCSDTLCGTECVDLGSDEANCGACGNACAAGDTCEAGVCETPCAGTECSGVCVDTDTDEANCGACGNACTGTDTCEAGACTPIGGGPLEACLECIDTVSGAAGFNETMCNPDSLCVAVRNCALDNAEGNACYTPIVAECYCGEGSDLTACETDPAFVETGACWEEIVAGLPAGLSNSEILQQIYAYDQPTGRAMLIVEEARANTECATLCGL